MTMFCAGCGARIYRDHGLVSDEVYCKKCRDRPLVKENAKIAQR